MTLQQVYFYLFGLNSALLFTGEQQTIYDGSWKKYNAVISSLAEQLEDDIFNEFTVLIKTRQPGKSSATDDQQYVPKDYFQRKVFQAAQYLYDNYREELDDADPPERNVTSKDKGAVPTAAEHSRQAPRSTAANVEFNNILIQLVENLTLSEAKLTNDDKAGKKFIRKIKTVLPTAKSSLDILAHILKIAKECKIDTEQAMCLLGLDRS